MIGIATILASASLAATPQRTLSELLNVPFRPSELPAEFGFTSARTGVIDVSANGKRYHVVGRVAAAVAGPDPEDAIAWDVFPTHAAALADLHHPALPRDTHIVGIVAGVRDSQVLEGSLDGRGLTDAVAVVGNVLVQAVTASSTSSVHGNRFGTLALLHAGIAHLRRLGTIA